MKFMFGNPEPGIGNILIVGQSKTGKTTLLKKIVLSSVLSRTRIIYFDIDKGAFIFCQLTDGKWIDLGNDSKQGIFAPVKALSDKMLTEFLTTLVEIEKGKITSEEKAALASAIQIVKEMGIEQHTISGLISYVMDEGLKNVLKNLANDGIFGAKEEHLGFDSNFLCLECKRLFESGKKSATVLSYLFHRIGSLAGGDPIFIIFDDASLALNNEYLEDKLLTQINNMRKRNVSFIFAIHNISDISNRLKDTLLNHCGIRIYTPNNQLSTNSLVRSSYQSMGLSDDQLELIATGKPKKEYTIQTADGKYQIIDLMIQPGSITHAITGGSNINDIKMFERLVAEHCKDKAIKEYLRMKRGMKCMNI